jgi:hypothetical protein
MTRDGDSRVLADRIDGEPIGQGQLRAARFEGHIWITISTRITN